MDGEDLVKELELLLGHLLIELIDGHAVEVLDVLETVNYKALEGFALEYFVVQDYQVLQRLKTLQ